MAEQSATLKTLFMFLNTTYSSYSELTSDIRDKKLILRVDVYHYVKAIEFLDSLHTASLIVLLRFLPSLAVVILFSIFSGKMYFLLFIVPAVMSVVCVRLNSFAEGFLATIGLSLISFKKYSIFAIPFFIPLLNEVGKRISFLLLSDSKSKKVLYSEDNFIKAYQSGIIVLEKNHNFYKYE